MVFWTFFHVAYFHFKRHSPSPENNVSLQLCKPEFICSKTIHAVAAGNPQKFRGRLVYPVYNPPSRPPWSIRAKFGTLEHTLNTRLGLNFVRIGLGCTVIIERRKPQRLPHFNFVFTPLGGTTVPQQDAEAHRWTVHDYKSPYPATWRDKRTAHWQTDYRPRNRKLHVDVTKKTLPNRQQTNYGRFRLNVNSTAH